MRRRKGNKQRKILVISFIGLLFIMTVGYAAFNTNLSVTVKGNLKDLKKEVDDRVPINGLLFWGQSDNVENTLTILKDKSGNNDGVLHGFDNNSSSGYNDGILKFDGVDDYVDIGYANYDFKNSISYVVYVSIANEGKYTKIFSNQFELSTSNIMAGSGFGYSANGYFGIHFYDGTQWVWSKSDLERNIGEYSTLIGTYGGGQLKLYIDGVLMSSIFSERPISISTEPIFMGAQAYQNDSIVHFTKMFLKEAMIYDRELTIEEVESITNGFEKKYKK